jgi:hypothetical protein
MAGGLIRCGASVLVRTPLMRKCKENQPCKEEAKGGVLALKLPALERTNSFHETNINSSKE